MNKLAIILLIVIIGYVAYKAYPSLTGNIVSKTVDSEKEDIDEFEAEDAEIIPLKSQSKETEKIQEQSKQTKTENQINEQKDPCESIKCQDSVLICPDGFSSVCKNTCTEELCSECQSNCDGHTIAENKTIENKICAENWSCYDWSNCSNDQQTRTCTDQNNCGTIISKPIEMQNCSVSEQSPENPPQQPDSLKPIINEIMYSPKQDENYNEWLEIYNPSNQDSDLTDWMVCGKKLLAGYINRADGSTQSENGLLLKSHRFAVITDGDSGTDVYTNFNVDTNSFALHVNAGSICSRLSNSGKTIILENSNGEIINSVTYTNEFANGNGKTLERKSDGSWAESLLDGGTPGKLNSV